MSEDSRFSVFDFEEDLFLDPIDIFGHEAVELLKVSSGALQESGWLLEAATQLPAFSPEEHTAAVPVGIHPEAPALVAAPVGFPSEGSAPVMLHPQASTSSAAAANDALANDFREPNEGTAAPSVPIEKLISVRPTDAAALSVPIEGDTSMPNEDVIGSSAGPFPTDPSLLIPDKLHHCVQTLSSKVEQVAVRARGFASHTCSYNIEEGEATEKFPFQGH